MTNKFALCAWLMTAMCMAGQQAVTTQALSTTDKNGPPSADSMKTAYVYLNWYISQFKDDQLTPTQKDRLEELKKQVETSLTPSHDKSTVDTHQLWQQLGQLEQELSVIASALNMQPPPFLFCGAHPMTSTQLSVRPPKRTPNPQSKMEEGVLTPKQEATSRLNKCSAEFDPNED